MGAHRTLDRKLCCRALELPSGSRASVPGSPLPEDLNTEHIVLQPFPALGILALFSSAQQAKQKVMKCRGDPGVMMPGSSQRRPSALPLPDLRTPCSAPGGFGVFLQRASRWDIETNTSRFLLSRISRWGRQTHRLARITRVGKYPKGIHSSCGKCGERHICSCLAGLEKLPEGGVFLS